MATVFKDHLTWFASRPIATERRVEKTRFAGTRTTGWRNLFINKEQGNNMRRGRCVVTFCLLRHCGCRSTELFFFYPYKLNIACSNLKKAVCSIETKMWCTNEGSSVNTNLNANELLYMNDWMWVEKLPNTFARKTKEKWKQLKINSGTHCASGALAMRCWLKALMEESHAVESVIRQLHQTAGDEGFDYWRPVA